MDEELEIILRAVDDASSTFQSVSESANEMGTAFEESATEASTGFDEMETSATSATGSIQDVIDYCNSVDGSGLSDAASAAEELEEEVNDAADAMSRFSDAGDIMAAEKLSEISENLADSMMNMANTAGNFEDSMTRVGLAAEGAGIPVDDVKSSISELSEETGRSGGLIREAFISMSSAGVTEMSAIETVFKGASAQAFILGTDVDGLVNKFSGMAMKSSIAEKTLKGTGITVEELGEVLGIQGATIDEVNDKWETMDVNARAAALGQAAAMNEGKDANDEYKNSWQGLQDQIEIAKGKLERVAGEVLLPVLVPAMKLAGDILQGVGDTISWVMSSPLGGLISVLGTAAGLFLVLVTGVGALSTMISFLGLESSFTTIETIALALAEEGLSIASLSAAIGSLGLSGGLMATATAAWGAATAVWALIAPLLPFIVAAALVAVAIYEVGKAFGWWTDVGSMLDAIWAGIQRLWSAFINHPDVQAVIGALTDAWNALVSAIGWAWNAILEFFGVATGGEFDIVRALIDGISQAWELITAPIRIIIGLFQLFYSVGQQVASGQMDIMTAISTLWNGIYSIFNAVLGGIISRIVAWISQLGGHAVTAATTFVTNIINNIRALPGRFLQVLQRVALYILLQANLWVLRAVNGAKRMFQGIINNIMNLPSRVYNYMLQIANKITSGASSWFSKAKTAAGNIVKGVTGAIADLPAKVYNKVLDIGTQLTKVGSTLYNKAKKVGEQIWNGIKSALGMGGAAGYELPGSAAGYELTTTQTVELFGNVGNVTLPENLSIDLLGNVILPEKLSIDLLGNVILPENLGLNLLGNVTRVNLPTGMNLDLIGRLKETVLPDILNIDLLGRLKEIILPDNVSIDLLGNVSNVNVPDEIYNMEETSFNVVSKEEEELTVTVKEEIDFNFDFNNLPDNINQSDLESMLKSMLTDKSVINTLVSNPDFQTLDNKVKNRILARNGRMRGV